MTDQRANSGLRCPQTVQGGAGLDKCETGVQAGPAVETSTPLRTRSSAPRNGPYRTNARCMSPVPRVSVANALRKPMRPREGASNTSRCLPDTSVGCISSSSALRTVSACPHKCAKFIQALEAAQHAAKIAHDCNKQAARQTFAQQVSTA